VHCGRADNEIKIRGFRVSPAEIEVELLKLPGIRDAAVVGIEGRERRLAAYIVGSTSQSAADLREYLAARLPAPMVPAAFVFIDRMPLTLNGKVDRNALPEPVWAPRTECRAVSGELEARVAASFAEILACDPVGADGNFFDLGGDSLSASRLARLLRSRLQIELPLRAVVRNPTPAALATYVRGRYPAIEDG
jgi:acyl carrier protein